MVSIYNLAQQITTKTGKGTWQEVEQAVRNAYSAVVKREWYTAKGLDINEINGAFIVSFKNQIPILDTELKQYYITIPSTYLGLPQENGINTVAYMSELDVSFVMCNIATVGRLNSIKAGVMGGIQLFYVANDGDNGSMRMYFPRMNNQTALPIFLAFTLALDTYDVDAPLNIPADIQNEIVNMVIALYTPQPTPINEQIK